MRNSVLNFQVFWFRLKNFIDIYKKNTKQKRIFQVPINKNSKIFWKLNYVKKMPIG